MTKGDFSSERYENVTITLRLELTREQAALLSYAEPLYPHILKASVHDKAAELMQKGARKVTDSSEPWDTDEIIRLFDAPKEKQPTPLKEVPNDHG